MHKLVRNVLICLLISVSIYMATLFRDKHLLSTQLIRLHIVANSDEEQDQSVKLYVRDQVNAYLKNTMSDITDIEQARAYILDNLPTIRRIANEALLSCGLEPDAVVTFCKEAFPKRIYESFSLPAGVYQALRITIGEGQGKNWWCVAFPDLCLPDSGKSFRDVAAGYGFPQTVSETLVGNSVYIPRFFLLDCIGRLENIIFNPK